MCTKLLNKNPYTLYINQPNTDQGEKKTLEKLQETDVCKNLSEKTPETNLFPTLPL